MSRTHDINLELKMKNHSTDGLKTGIIHCSVVIRDIMRAGALLWFQSIKGHLSFHVHLLYHYFLKE